MKTSIEIVREPLEAILAPEVVSKYSPKPEVLHAVRSAKKRGISPEHLSFQQDEINEALTYMADEAKVIPPDSIQIEEVSTGKILAVLGPQHLWTPPARYREGPEGTLISCQGAGLPQIHPEVYSFLIQHVADKERYNKAFEKYKETGLAREDLPLAFPEGRALVAEQCLVYAKDRFSSKLAFPVVPLNQGVGTEEHREVLAVSSFPVLDAKTANPRFSGRHSLPPSLSNRAQKMVLKDVITFYAKNALTIQTHPAPTSSFKVYPLAASPVSNPSSSQYADISEAYAFKALPFEVQEIQVRSRVVDEMWQVGLKVVFKVKCPLEFRKIPWDMKPQVAQVILGWAGTHLPCSPLYSGVTTP